MSAARGVGTLSIIRIEPATVNQELIASVHVRAGGEEGSRSRGWWKDTDRRGEPDQTSQTLA